MTNELLYLIRALTGDKKDPKWDRRGNKLPTQKSLDAPIYVPGITPLPEQGTEGVSDPERTVGGVAAALAERERQRRLLLEQMGPQ